MPSPDQIKLYARERRYKDKYYIDMAYYNALGEVQGWKCAICGRPASDFKLPLIVDHKHFKVVAHRLIGAAHWKWQAETVIDSVHFREVALTKAEAIEKVKRKATPYSIRGLLCPGRHGPAGTTCNRNLGRVDKQSWLRAAADYLDDPPAKKVLDFIPKL